jgi:hypothetical protein
MTQTLSAVAPTSPWTGTNLYLNIILLIGAIFGGMSGDTAGVIVGAAAGVVAAVGLIRAWIVSAKFDSGFINNPNVWAYITAIVVAFAPKAAELIPALQGLFEALKTGNWGSVISAGVTLISMIYFTFFKRN